MSAILDWPILLPLVATVVATLMVVVEIFSERKRFRSLRLTLAAALLGLSIGAILTGAVTGRQLENERKADLLFIQKQNEGLNSLCFELELKPHDERYDKGCILLMQTSANVIASTARTGFLGEYINLDYHPDTGWYRNPSHVHAWPSINLRQDSAGHAVRFELTPFGIRSQTEKVLRWKADRLVDLTQIRFSFQASYGIDPDEYYTAPDDGWCPVRAISLFANSYDPENLVASLVPYRQTVDPYHNVVYFYPDRQSINEEADYSFTINLFHVRSHLLDLIESGDL